MFFPRHKIGLYNRILVLEDSGRLNLAMKEIDKLLKKDSKSADHLYLKARAKIIMGRLSDSAALLKKALHLDKKIKKEIEEDELFKIMRNNPQLKRLNIFK